MNPQNTDMLYRDFPWLYRGRHKPLTESLMSYGFECDDGWLALIHQLSQQITDYCQRTGIDVEAIQVKEKFGRLRFRILPLPLDPVLQQCIEEAENLSETICEICGKPGELKGLKTLCPEHFRRLRNARE